MLFHHVSHTAIFAHTRDIGISGIQSNKLHRVSPSEIVNSITNCDIVFNFHWGNLAYQFFGV